jgi:hAT family C-terminal dimerisation region
MDPTICCSTCTCISLTNVQLKLRSFVCCRDQSNLVNHNRIWLIIYFPFYWRAVARCRQELQELYSIIRPLVDIVVEAQTAKYPVCARVVLMLATLRKEATGLLSLGAPLMRTKLRAPMDSRFYTEYSSAQRRSNMLDMNAALHPCFTGLNHLDVVMGATQAAVIRQKVWDDIEKRGVDAIIAKRAQLAARDDSDMHSDLDALSESNAGLSLAGSEGPPRKLFRGVTGSRQRAAAAARAEADEGFLDFADAAVVSVAAPQEQTPQVIMRAEIESFKLNEKASLREVPLDGMLAFWQKAQTRYPNLAHVAQQVLGHSASAGAIEREFGIGSSIMSPRRGSLDAGMFEVLLFLWASFDIIPKFIPDLSCTGTYKDYRDLLPRRLTGAEGPHCQAGSDSESLSDSEDEALELDPLRAVDTPNVAVETPSETQ